VCGMLWPVGDRRGFVIRIHVIRVYCEYILKYIRDSPGMH
jgi:hypothetical protein